MWFLVAKELLQGSGRADRFLFFIPRKLAFDEERPGGPQQPGIITVTRVFQSVTPPVCSDHRGKESGQPQLLKGDISTLQTWF